MKIISKFHDYYDSASAYGVDTTQVLLRKQQTLTFSERWKDTSPYWSNMSFNFFVVGFCGEWYRGIRAQRVGPKDECRFYFHSKQLKDDFISKALDLESTKRSRWYDTSPDKRLEKWLAEPVRLDAWKFFEHKASVLLLTPNPQGRVDLTVWPKLSDWGFQKVKSPYEAYQEISMYQFGVIGCTEKNTVDISDKDRYDMRGFDMKYGFRKRPKQK